MLPAYEAWPLETLSPEERGGHVDQEGSYAAMLADNLAWAVRQNIPLEEALLALPFYQKWLRKLPRWLVNGLFGLSYPFLFAIPPSNIFTKIRWTWRVQKMAGLIRAGYPLHVALEKSFKYYFPGFYHAGVERAEQEGRLPEMLPVLAEQLSYPRWVAAERIALSALTWAKSLVFVLILWFLCLIILPKFDHLFYQLAGSEGAQYFPAVFHYIGAPFFGIGFTVIGLLVFLSYMPEIGDRIRLFSPLARRDTQRFMMLEFARGMVANLQSGDDMVTAGKWVEKSTRRPMLKRKVRQFVVRMEKGEHWFDAWKGIGLGSDMDHWIMHNGALREDPISAFDTVCDWMLNDIGTATRRFVAWSDPVMTVLMGWLLLALGVGVFRFFGTIFQLMQQEGDVLF